VVLKKWRLWWSHIGQDPAGLYISEKDGRDVSVGPNGPKFT
jgi:hypothetical protein